jgi:hypothetical protein
VVITLTVASRLKASRERRGDSRPERQSERQAGARFQLQGSLGATIPGVSSLRAFGRDVASDALARWSGGGGILFALAAFVFPKLLNGPWPFLILGVACVMAACVRAWFVAYQRTIPGFEVVSEHPDSVLRSDTRYPRVRHRVVIRSKGLTPIDDVHVFLIMGASGGERSDLLAVGKDSERDLRLYHDVPLAFELFSYRS